MADGAGSAPGSFAGDLAEDGGGWPHRAAAAADFAAFASGVVALPPLCLVPLIGGSFRIDLDKKYVN
jgi:hypothetical protein